MFDFGIGSFELMVLAIVAIIVVGPKDLPKLLRAIGQFTTKVRGMAREFQGYIDEAARESGLDDVKKDIKSATNFDVNEMLNSDNAPAETATKNKAEDEIDPIEEANNAAREEAAKVRAADEKAEKDAADKAAAEAKA